MTRAWLLSFLITTLSCAAASDPPAGATHGSSSRMEPTSSRCLRPDELDPVLAPTKLREGTAMLQLALDGSHLYFSVGSSIYRVAKRGGRSEALFSSGGAVAPPFALREERLLAVADGKLLSLPKSGGTASTLAELPHLPASDPLGGTTALVFDSDAAYFAGRSSEGVVIDRVDLGDGSSQVLGHARQLPAALALAGQSVYWVEGAREPASRYSQRLMSIPRNGGEAHELALDLGPLHLAFDVISGAAQQLFLDVRLNLDADNSDGSAISAAGIYRLPASGGKAEQLVERSALDVPGLFGMAAPSKVVASVEQIFILGGSLQNAELYSLANSAAVPQRRLCLALNGASVVNLAAEHDAVYLALAVGGQSLILRHEL